MQLVVFSVHTTLIFHESYNVHISVCICFRKQACYCSDIHARGVVDGVLTEYLIIKAQPHGLNNEF